MIFSFGNQEAYGNPLEQQLGIHATSLLIELGTLDGDSFCAVFFPGASITVKTVPSIETSCLHNKKVTAWRENLAGEARITKAKCVCIYTETNSTRSWPEQRRMKSLLIWQRTRLCKADESQRPTQALELRWFTSSGFSE